MAEMKASESIFDFVTPTCASYYIVNFALYRPVSNTFQAVPAGGLLGDVRIPYYRPRPRPARRHCPIRGQLRTRWHPPGGRCQNHVFRLMN